ncbi:Pimeloyl-[acyl-carrier protein] methyl ester esterase [Candidatus Arsenophonus lipoptenae]|uniref:Pimeloyl-[acyl-carrier protein] methyl ester esterase n=1 Tax=Candidatus Arsenophonus lipoptenae TaxID=634113 RepID=A0A0X9VUZ0_9GAMM|nr:pimeloyl-ACP methyl ester esterase BioH [Candidatus Arsenophonus lipoptenae]AMA64923.1 Pimeloyl-[acyl-carrier protein] methyl ester esterase [Candidatus Arsenophonus lipoptenae]
MNDLFWQRLGKGKQDVVLLHGWCSNAEVWRNIALLYNPYFCFHIIDLPGYGRNNIFPPMTLQQMSEIIWHKAPKYAIWVGWSLGGLLASTIALQHTSEISGLITIASSPFFIQKDNWPGINPVLLINFKQQLKIDFHRTIKSFLVLQTLGIKKPHNDINFLKSTFMSQPLPSISVLNKGLEILLTNDLRKPLSQLKISFLRIYGELDNLVPKKIVSIIDKWLPNSSSVIIKYAAHVPFISHPHKFLHLLIDFYNHTQKNINFINYKNNLRLN